MKKAIFIIAFLSAAVGMRGQKANAVFFTENGERFYVVMNGLRQNEEARTNVRVEGIAPGAYKCRIFFDEKSIPSLDKTIYPEGGKEQTFVIKKKSESKASKKTKGFTNNIIKNFGSEDTLNTADKGSWYVMRLLSMTDIPQSTEPEDKRQVIQQPSTGVSSQSTTTTETPSTSSSVSMGVNMSATGIDVNANETHTERTTVISSTSASGRPEDHYVMPGYDGAIGCPWPLNDADFRAAKQSITSKDFEDSKITVAKQVINNNCLLSRQVRDLMRLFTFEDTRLELAKYAYRHTYDVNNYYEVNDAFEFESSIGELDEYIHSQR